MSGEIERVQPANDRTPARTDTDSWAGMFGSVVELARGIADTEFVPRGLRGSIPATTAAILYGREIGLPPMTALNQTHVIEGKPSLAAEAMRALVLAAGHEIQVLESTGGVCRMRARRRGSETWTPDVVWTIDMARAAGLLGKNNWKNHPRRMLQARASSELCELHFPDVVLGFKSIEEMQDEADLTGSDDTPRTTAVQRTRKRAEPKKAAAPALPPLAPGGVIPSPPLPGEDDPTDPGPATPRAGNDGEAATPPTAASPSNDTSSAPGVSAPAEPTPAPSTSGASKAASAEEAETDVGEAGGPADVTSEEDPGAPSGSAGSSSRPPGRATKAQQRMLFAQLKQLEVKDEWRHDLVSRLLGRTIESFTEISKDEIRAVIDTLSQFKSLQALTTFMQTVDQPSLLKQATQRVEVAEPPLPVEEPPAAPDEDGAYEADVVEDES